jgi:phosphate:Na+ symporter
VGFNLFTATLAFLLLPAYLAVIRTGGLPAVSGEPPFLLTAFHTGFNLLGVALMLPFTHPFARLIRLLVRTRQERPAEALEELPQGSSPRHLDRVEQALGQIFRDLLAQLQRSLRDGDSGGSRGSSPSVPLEVLQADLDRIELTLDQVQLGSLAPPQGRRLIELLHGLDHLQRLHERCEEESDRARTVRRAGWLRAEREDLLTTLERLQPLVRQGCWPEAMILSSDLAERIGQRVTPFRDQVLEQEASGAVDAERGTELLQAIRWLGRVSSHLRKICRHLGWNAPGRDPPQAGLPREAAGE